MFRPIAFSRRYLLHCWTGLLVVILFHFTLVFSLAKAVIGQQTDTSVAVVSAANDLAGAPVAPESMATAYGLRLATGTAVADSSPLPKVLEGTTVKVNSEAAQLFFVSPAQVNFLVPAGTPAGEASITITSADGAISTGKIKIAVVAPALFTGDGNGKGPLASLLYRLKKNGETSYEPLLEHNGTKFIPKPIVFGAGDQIFLVLFMTGVRQASSGSLRVSIGGVEHRPSSIASSSGFAGLDQVNVELPRSLIGCGRVKLLVTAKGYGGSNEGEIEIKGQDSDTPELLLHGPLNDPVLVGEELEVAGEGFSANPDENKVQIVADDGDARDATVLAVTGTSLRLRVPFQAGTGMLRVARGSSSASLPIKVRTSVSGFLEEASRLANTNNIQRVPIAGAIVRLLVAPPIERVTDGEGSFVLPDVPTEDSMVQILSPPGTLYADELFKVTIKSGRDNHVLERGVELTRVGDRAFTTQAESHSPSAFLEPQAPDATLTFLLPGRTPVNLPISHFSTSIVQITPFGQNLAPETRVSFPNTDAIAAGTKARLYKFDQTPGSLRLGEFVDIGEATVTADGQRVETAAGAITEGSYYFASIARPLATISGRVVERDGRPVPHAIVQTRGQSIFTDGLGGFVLRNVPVMKPVGDKLSVEVSYQRPGGRISRKDNIEVEVTAGALATIKPDIVLDPVAMNFPPVLIAPPSLTITNGEPRDFDFIVTDPDSTQPAQIALSGNAAPFFSLSKPGANLCRLHLLSSGSGNYTLTLKATDSLGASSMQQVAVMFAPLPTGSPIAYAQSVAMAEDTPAAITLRGFDPGNRPLSFIVVTSPARGKFSDNNGAPNLIYTPSPNFNGLDRFAFKVKAGESESEPVTGFIAVSPVNDAPVLSLPGDLTVTAGETLNLPITATDVDGDANLNFSAAGLPMGASFTAPTGGGRVLSWTPLVQQIGLHRIAITVSDSGSPVGSDTKTLTISVGGKWAKTSGPEGISIGALLFFDGVLYAGGDGGIYRSTDNGATWAYTSNGILNRRIFSLAAIGNTIFAGTERDGVYRSTDNGTNWTKVSRGLSSGNIQALGVNGQTLFAGTLGGGLCRSDNLGESWQLISNGIPAGIWVKSFTSLGETIFASTRGHGVFRSSDDGRSWTAVNSGLTNLDVQTLATQGTAIFAGNWEGGMHRSTDNGATWKPINNGLPSNLINQVLAVGDKLLVSPFAAGIYLSTDGGNSWRSANDGLTQSLAGPFAGNEQYLFAGSAIGTFRTQNSAALRWTQSSSGQTSPIISALALNGSTLFAGGFGSGINRTLNDGTSWERKDIYSNLISALLVADGVVYAGFNAGVISRSFDNGATWEGSGANAWITALANNGSTLFAGGAEGKIFRSTNRGKTWRAMGDITSGEVPIGHLLWFNGALYAATGGAGVFRSTNNAVSWRSVNTGLAPDGLGANKLAVSRNTLYLATGSGVFRLVGNSERWESVSQGLSGWDVKALIADGDVLFAGTQGGGIFRTDDGGASWMNVSDGLADRYVFDLAVRERTIYAATTGGVYKLFNTAQAWNEINRGITNQSLNALVLSESGWLVGTLGGGSFKSADRGQNWAPANSGLPAYSNIQSLVTNNQTFWATDYGGGVYRSTDYGTSWTAVNLNLGNRFVNKLFLDGSTLYAGTDQGVFRSTDGGESWESFSAGLGARRVVSFAARAGGICVGTYGSGVFCLNSDGSGWRQLNHNGLTSLNLTALAAQDNLLYAGTGGGGICLSKDGGETWSAVNNQLPSNLHVFAFAIAGKKVYAGGIHGIFLTEDEGRSWKQVNAGLLNTFVTGLAISGDQLFASTASGGVFVSRIP